MPSVLEIKPGAPPFVAAPDLARELMMPAQKITEIKVLQANGVFGGGAGGGSGEGGAVGVMSPIMKTLMEAGAAYPLVRELMAFGRVDPGQLGDKARELLASMGPELQKALASRSGGNGQLPAGAVPVADAEE